MASTGFGFALGFACDFAPAAVPLPPTQPSFDLNMSAASPSTSGTNFGSAVVPLTWNGTVKPLIHPPPATLPRIPARPPPASPPPPFAAAWAPARVATILKSRLFLESAVPAPVRLPSCGRTAMKLSAFSPSGDMRTCEVSRSEEHTSELQSRLHLVCRLLLEKKKKCYSQLPLH